MSKDIFSNPLGDLLFWKLITGNTILLPVEKSFMERIDFQMMDLGLPNITTAHWIDHKMEVDSQLLDSFPIKLKHKGN